MINLLAAEGGYQVFHLRSGDKLWLLFSGGHRPAGHRRRLRPRPRASWPRTRAPTQMKEIAAAIQEGAIAYLKRQFKTILVILVPLVVIVFITSTKTVKPDGHVALVVRRVRGVPDARLHRRRLPVRPHRLPGHEPGHARQRPHRGGRQVGQHAQGPVGGVPHRRRRRHVHRRARPARRHDHHHRLPEQRLRHPGRLRLRRLAAGPVPAGRRRHLHQGGRRRRRPGRQGREGHPRGRPAQPGDHRRQRRRQRRRLRRHGRRPVRVLRGHARGLDHPRRRRLPVDRRQPGARRSSSR